MSFPRFVEVKVESNAKPGECFEDVRRKVERDGGGIQYGWAIWFLPGIMMEAEFHAVWVSPCGQLLDISPRPFAYSKIMFLPDLQRIHKEGKQIDNFRIPLNKDPRVREFIQLAEQHFKIMNEGDLANKVGPVLVEKDKILPVIQRMVQLVEELQD